MEVEFGDPELDRLEVDPRFTGGFQSNIVSAYRRRLQQIRASVDERDLSLHGGARFKKLQGKRSHQYSMRLNDQWRLILELRGDKTVYVVGIEDYHD